MTMMMMMKSDPFTYYWQVKGTVSKRVVGKRGYTRDDDDDDEDEDDDDEDLTRVDLNHVSWVNSAHMVNKVLDNKRTILSTTILQFFS